MAWTSGFFNSVNGDRLYNADQMSHIFEGLITDGVYESVADKLAVQPNSGMTIQIATGRGWFNKRWVNNDSEYTLTVADSDVILNRYVAVVIKVDTTDSVRDAVPYLKYGEFATNPVKPTMERTETVKEYCLAYIYVGAGVSEITASVIEDARADESVCGWVTGLIEQLNSATLFEQFTAIFYEWFENLTDKINENTEAMLVGALPTSIILDIPVSSWSDNAATIDVTGMTDTKTILCSPDDNTKDYYFTAGVKLTGQTTNKLTFTCDTVPSELVRVKIVHMGV